MSLHYFASINDLDGVRRCLERGDAIEGTPPGSEVTPLMSAAQSSKAGVEMLRYLVERGAAIGAASAEYALTALGCAARSGCPEKVRFLLEAGADPNFLGPGGSTALQEATYTYPHEHADLLALLLEAGADPNLCGPYQMPPLLIASSRGRTRSVRQLLRAGADPAPLGWGPLFELVAFGRSAESRRALEAGPDLTVRDHFGRTPWLLAVHLGELDKAIALLEAGSDPAARTKSGDPALLLAAERGNLPMATWLLEQGVHVDEGSDSGRTALMTAAVWGGISMVRLLLQAGASPLAICSMGDTALTCTTLPDIIRLLVEAGSRVDHVSDYGSWSLGFAADCGEVETVRLLLELGADVNLNPGDGTALHAAVTSGNLDCIALLLNAGADLDARDEEGRTPRDLAWTPDIEALLGSRA